MQHECNTDYTIAKYIPYIKPKYVTQEGTTVLYVRYNYNRNKRTLISTGYNIKPEHWDAKGNGLSVHVPIMKKLMPA
ncbi:Arm DNA-binding domain-containing protein [Bacteroides thetaiotaomicron]|nr:Arm DNA-binding domain-containing protein [Bacteroides thetaiotaomicron]MCS2684198.1 Arm DNA-binding domain-containing protein [Bacteroides thetaiotaomicron]MCS3263684.1 Arm DNA-binding domain-containing protein [Bacteroides thetaiotaomicron]